MGRQYSKRRAQSRPTLTKFQQRQLSRYAKRLVIWRYTEDGDGTPVRDNAVFRGHVPTEWQAEAFYLAVQLTHEWTCVSITYCRDPWGREYHLLGQSQSNPIKANGDGIYPTIIAAFNKAEENCNTKHIYARGCVFAPKSPELPTLTNAFWELKDALHLTDDDIQAIEAFEDSDHDTLEYDLDEARDLDQQIANLL